jgi:hypothetical protein
MWKYLNKGISAPIAIIVILTLAIIVGGITWLQHREIEKERINLIEIELLEKEDVEEVITKKIIEYIEDRKGIRVLEENGEIIFEYWIHDFREWAKENWDNIFKEPPAFGGLRKVELEHFYSFNNTASLSPEYDYLAFSVHDYSVSINISFIGIVNLKNEEVNLVKEKNIGAIQNLFWSSEGNHVAYILDTARAQGDYLSVDNVKTMTKEFTLSEKELEKQLILEQSFFMPYFKDLEWKEDRVYFKTRDLENEGNIEWSIMKDGTGLEIE